MFWLQDLKGGQTPIKSANSETSYSANGRHRTHLHFKWCAIESKNIQHIDFTTLLLIRRGFEKTPRYGIAVFVIHRRQPVRQPQS